MRDKILSRPRAREIAERPDPADSLEELRRKYGGQGVSDEEVLLRFFTSEADVARMRAAGPPRRYGANGNPLLDLIAGLSQQNNRSRIYIEGGGVTLRMEKRLD